MHTPDKDTVSPTLTTTNWHPIDAMPRREPATAVVHRRKARRVDRRQPLRRGSTTACFHHRTKTTGTSLLNQNHRSNSPTKRRQQLRAAAPYTISSRDGGGSSLAVTVVLPSYAVACCLNEQNCRGELVARHMPASRSFTPFIAHHYWARSVDSRQCQVAKRRALSPKTRRLAEYRTGIWNSQSKAFNFLEDSNK
jgi:hypothetical protein